MTAAALLFAFSYAASANTAGIATADGGFRVAGLPVSGTSSVGEGALVETETRPARLMLKGGQTVELGVKSRARIFSDRLYLESGSSAVSGSLKVLNGQGILVARTAQAPVFFSAQAVPSSATELTGLLEMKDGVPVIHDEASRLTFPLEAKPEIAEQLAQSAGNKVTIKGVLHAGKVQVSTVQAVAAAGTAAGTAAAATVATGSAASTSAATGAVVAAGVSKAVIAGVAIAGAAATGATVGFVQTQSGPSSTISQ